MDVIDLKKRSKAQENALEILHEKITKHSLGEKTLGSEISASSSSILTPNAKLVTFNDLIALGNGQPAKIELSEADLESLEKLSLVAMHKLDKKNLFKSLR